MKNIRKHQPKEETLTVADYIREEVFRQGHDVWTQDGIERCEWMTDAWVWAQAQAKLRTRPTLDDIIEIGQRIEPGKNRHGLRTCGVRVGSRICPYPEDVPRMLVNLLDHGSDLEPLSWYKEFELIHPFLDGNGRTGKVLLAWLSGTFDSPYFPPSDLFGYPIVNP